MGNYTGRTPRISVLYIVCCTHKSHKLSHFDYSVLKMLQLQRKPCPINYRWWVMYMLQINDTLLNEYRVITFESALRWILKACSQDKPGWASCQIRKIAGAHAPGMPGTFSPSPQVSDPDMHHGTCVTHVPWCMPGSLTIGFLWNRRRGKTFPAFPAYAQPAILRIW